MSRFYFRYMNRPEKLKDMPHKWYPKIGAACPGNVTDKRNALPGGFKRFDRYYKYPIAARKLYWRRNERREFTNEVRNSQ